MKNYEAMTQLGQMPAGSEMVVSGSFTEAQLEKCLVRRTTNDGRVVYDFRQKVIGMSENGGFIVAFCVPVRSDE